jgi:pentatricopeptide repeat protein
MLRPKKKITKKEMKEDALVSTYVKVTSFYDQYKRTISIATTAVVVVVIATVVFLKNRADNNERAFQQLGEIHQFFDNGQYQVAIDGIPERNIIGLASIADNNGSTTAGNLARFYLANAYFQLGKFDEALEMFEKFSAGDDALAASRYAGIAGCQEVKGDYAEAGKNFERAASAYKNENSEAENLNSAARNFALANDKEKAVELYKRLKKDHPTTTYGRDADRHIAQFSV